MDRLIITFALMLTSAAVAQDQVFSGPQVGEKLTPFGTRLVLGESAGQEFDLVTKADGNPLLIVFVHELTRPSIGLTRTVLNYAKQREKDGLTSGIVFLASDATAMETRVKRASHALPKGIPIGISVDGQEGPGAYGLNRKMALTVLVGKDGLVTANFPLIQPSVAVDGPEIGHAIVRVLGGDKKPTLAEMGAGRDVRMRGVDDGTFRSLLGPVIRKTASPEQVDKAAKAVEEYAAKHDAFRRRLATVANRIISAGKLENYGTPPAREYIKKWAKEYAEKKNAEQKGNDNDDKPD